MNSIFSDTKFHEKLEEDGFIKIQLLNTAEISKLMNLYDNIKQTHKDKASRLFVSSRDCDYDTSIRISNNIKEILQPKFEKIAANFSLYGGTFLVKYKFDSNEFNLHQDYTLVEPEKHQMYAIWIALQDTSEQNGAVFFLEKTHRLFNSYISATYNNSKIYRKNIHPKFIKTVSLKAGEAMIFCDGTFHGSYSNLCDKDRVAVTARITDKDAPFVYYQKKNESKASIYSIQPSDLIRYFTEFQQGKLPVHLTLIDEIPYKHLHVNSKMLNRKLMNNGDSTIKIFLKRIWMLFN